MSTYYAVVSALIFAVVAVAHAIRRAKAQAKSMVILSLLSRKDV